VDTPVSLKKNWVLTQQAFDSLLNNLDSDRDQAGKAYERIRNKLVKFFEWRGAVLPDTEADETINRVARKLAEGAEVENLNAYFYGVARLVFAESLKASEKQQDALRQIPTKSLPVDDDPYAESRHTCLDGCLRGLPDKKRALIIEYYREEKGDKIKHRKHLADKLGVPLNALRIRAHRIRVGMESCVNECMEKYA